MTQPQFSPAAPKTTPDPATAATAKPIRKAGGAFLSAGFRPFFLFSALFAALAIFGWLAMLSGHDVLPTAFSAVHWHVHEMLYGYLSAVLTGFLLTALPNWTGRKGVSGMPLGFLVLLWLAGRAAVACSQWTGPVAAGIVDVAFLPVTLVWAARQLAAAGNWRNLPVLLIIATFIAGNITFHVEALHGDLAYGMRIGISAMILLIALIGGRVVPNFTTNWMRTRDLSPLPTPFSRYDGAVAIFTVLTLIAWIVLPEAKPVGVLLLVAGIGHVVRQARWRPQRTVSDRLLLVLHVGYGFLSLGFFGMACALLHPEIFPLSGMVHLWTAGAVGVMTIAVMTRATLGHTGSKLIATPATIAAYGCVILGSLLRVASALVSIGEESLLQAAGGLWALGFLIFAVAYFRKLTQPRIALR